MSYPYILQGQNIVLFIDNRVHTIARDHISYHLVAAAIRDDDWEEVKRVIEPISAVVNYGQGNVTVKDNVLFWKGQVMHSALTVRMIEMLKEGFSIDPFVKFMENLMQNPSYRSVEELYGFLEKNNLPITPDGHFLAFKKVRDTYFDVHSNTMDNSPGRTLEMPRNQVNDDANQTCSYGLHFCSKDYLRNFGGERTVIVKINPRDVVSIPVDYNQAKGRTCRYEVISELQGEPEAAFSKPVQNNANSVVKPVARPVWS